MKLSILTLGLILIFQCTLHSCESLELLHIQENIQEKPAKKINKKQKYTTLFITHKSNGTIPESSIAEVFLSDWEYQNLVIISGYTATDDLWEVISSKGNSNFDKIKIELKYLEIGSTKWENCMNEIYYLVSKKLPELKIES